MPILELSATETLSVMGQLIVTNHECFWTVGGNPHQHRQKGPTAIQPLNPNPLRVREQGWSLQHFAQSYTSLIHFQYTFNPIQGWVTVCSVYLLWVNQNIDLFSITPYEKESMHHNLTCEQMTNSSPCFVWHRIRCSCADWNKADCCYESTQVSTVQPGRHQEEPLDNTTYPHPVGVEGIGFILSFTYNIYKSIFKYYYKSLSE